MHPELLHLGLSPWRSISQIWCLEQRQTGLFLRVETWKAVISDLIILFEIFLGKDNDIFLFFWVTEKKSPFYFFFVFIVLFFCCFLFSFVSFLFSACNVKQAKKKLLQQTLFQFHFPATVNNCLPLSNNNNTNNNNSSNNNNKEN